MFACRLLGRVRITPRGRLSATSAVPIGRRILFELDELYYPIGNTKAVSWLNPHPYAIDHSGHCRVLSLGCGDPRNLLLTLGSLNPAGPLATATPQPATKASSCSYLELHANDHNPSIIARNMVLLALATEVDPASPTDMQLLFDMWYNLLWDKGSQVEARFKATIQHILDGRYPWMQVPRPSDMRKVHEVLRWWLEDAGQSTPAHILEIRQAAGGSAAGVGPGQQERLHRTRQAAALSHDHSASWDLDEADEENAISSKITLPLAKTIPCKERLSSSEPVTQTVRPSARVQPHGSIHTKQPFAELPAALQDLLQTCLRGCLPPHRRLRRTQKFANPSKATVTSFDVDATDQARSEPLLCETLPFNVQSEMLGTVLNKQDGGSMGGVLKADFLAWGQLGSLRGHQEQQWSKSTAESAVVNCTMLPPFETPVSRWTAHYDLQFMRGWAPLELHELQSVARPDQLASALQAAATAARARPAVEEAPLPGPWGAFPPCPAPPVDKAGARSEYRPALLNQTYQPGMLARACMVRMAAACVAMQRNARLGGPGEVVPMQLPPAGHSRPGASTGRSGVPAQLCFWLGDCLQLCQGPDLEQHWAHRPAAQPTVVGAPQQAQQEHPLPQPAEQPPLMFHVIDTSNVADHAGLLNLLIATQPRLAPHPLARLITCSMTWTLSFKSMREYLQSCLSCPPSMYPTLLGLRLVTDITAGRPQPLGMAVQLRAVLQDPRPLVWSKSVAAVGSAALSLSLMQSQQQLLAAGRLQCRDPQPGPRLALEPSRAVVQEVPAVEVLAATPGLALSNGLVDGSVPPRLETGALELHLEVLTRSCTPQVRQAYIRVSVEWCK
ncbi:MYND-type domain-containing protein, partial [Haematococcus lacustris]